MLGIMVSGSETLTREEFASLLIVGNTSMVFAPPAVIPAEHRARLIALEVIWRTCKAGCR